MDPTQSYTGFTTQHRRVGVKCAFERRWLASQVHTFRPASLERGPAEAKGSERFILLKVFASTMSSQCKKYQRKNEEILPYRETNV